MQFLIYGFNTCLSAWPGVVNKSIFETYDVTIVLSDLI